MPMVRLDEPDLIYKSEDGKYRAVVDEITDRFKRGQPILVGTTSIEKSERISRMLDKLGVQHSVLNAKLHEREADVIANAGQLGSVTIATNMAGRGTDIVLGQGVPNVGGLYIIGTERHESRRIDNQLRGRAGRQGDPGESRFFLSFEDDLMRVFGGERMQGIMGKLGVDEDTPIESKMVSRQIEGAQARVEGTNFDSRRHVVEYDDVMNKQREIIYGERRKDPRGNRHPLQLHRDGRARGRDRGADVLRRAASRDLGHGRTLGADAPVRSGAAGDFRGQHRDPRELRRGSDRDTQQRADRTL